MYEGTVPERQDVPKAMEDPLCFDDGDGTL
jgi:hypothetical protein